jgi:hypothetical protein
VLLGLQLTTAGVGGSNLPGYNDENVFFFFLKWCILKELFKFVSFKMHLMQIKMKHSDEKLKNIRTRTCDLCHHILPLYHCTTYASTKM